MFDISSVYQIFKEFPVVCTDTRNCVPGSLFFALKGDHFNANAFAADALAKGCRYAIIDEPEFAADERFIVVPSVLETLQQLATYHRCQLGTKIIGITGTNGKTTTKELIASVLKEKFNVHFTKGNLNNQIGVPVTLLQLTAEHEVAVVEMGANHPGEIRTLVNIARPDYGIITNVGKAHLEGFGSFEGVMNTKAELYDYIHAAGGQIFINTGNAFLNQMAEKAGITAESEIEYSLDKCNRPDGVKGVITSCSPFLSLSYTVADGVANDINTRLIGAYNAENVLAAVTIGRFMGESADQIKTGLESYVPQNNRSQLTLTDKNKLVVDAYNANPTSMRAAVMNFYQMDVENKVLILGDMLELGSQSEGEHQNMVDLLQQKGFERVMLVGSEFGKTKNKYPVFSTVDDLTNFLSIHPVENSFVLIKGSRGIRLEKVIGLL